MRHTISDYYRVLRNLPKYLKSGVGVNRLLEHYTKKVQPNKPNPVYYNWINKYENYDLVAQAQESEKFKLKPLISILMPVYNVELTVLKRAVYSVLNQSYQNFELIIADDNSTNQELKEYLEHLEKTNSKIKVIFREENGGISEATNSAFEEASGEYIGFLDNDDELAPNALFEVVKAINEDPNLELIYSDEDKIDFEQNRSEPHFKSDYAPDTLLSVNYICHFLVIKKSLLTKPLLNKEMDGAQDYDLVLRMVEKTNKIHHIPKILYHWRISNESTSSDFRNKMYIIDSGKKAIEEALKRRGLKGEVVPTEDGGFYKVNYEIIDTNKLVSIIIPTKDNAEDTYNCIQSIVENTSYPNYEIILINNNSTEPETFETFDRLREEVPNLHIYDLPIPFNYSKINNYAAKKAKGDFYLFLNNDTKVITPNWMSQMVGYAQQPWVGAVGVKLLYPDNTIQHAGVILGLMGIAGHVYPFIPSNEGGYMRRLKTVMNYSAVTAACLMVEKDKFWAVDGFDENIAIAFNDVDLCCKLVDAGYYNVYLPDVVLIHYESKSRGYETTSDKILRFEKEKGIIRKKWRPLLDNDPMYNPNLSLYRADFWMKE